MAKRILLVIMTLMMLISLTACSADPIAEAKESVVRIYAEYDYFDAQGYSISGDYLYEDGSIVGRIGSAAATGSGFAVGDDEDAVRYFVTNRHVVEDEVIKYVTAEDYEAWKNGAETVSVRTGYCIMTDAYIVYDNSTNKIPAKVQYISEDADMALLFIHTPTDVRKPATLRPYKENEFTNNHAQVYALGFPGAADRGVDVAGDLVSTIDKITVTNGIISNVISRAESGTGQGELIQHNTAINSGNSGGPLVDVDGRVLGINTSGFNASVASGINYATSINDVIRMLDAQGVPYLTQGNTLSAKTIGIIVMGVLIAAVVVVVVITARKQRKPAAMRTISGVQGVLAGRNFALKPGARVIMGSDAQCNVCLKDAKGVSRMHCSIKFDGKSVVVKDENSTYGTFIDGVKLEKGAAAVWHRNQQLSLGSESESFKLS